MPVRDVDRERGDAEEHDDHDRGPDEHDTALVAVAETVGQATRAVAQPAHVHVLVDTGSSWKTAVAIICGDESLWKNTPKMPGTSNLWSAST